MIFTSSSGTIINNGITSVVTGSPFKPNTMSQGSDLSNSLHSYANNSGSVLSGKKSWGTSSDQYTLYKKIQAVGKTATKTGLPVDGLLTYKSVESTSRNSAVIRCRSGGCVAPKKKGADRM
jgi:hypothetical protein